MAPLRWWLRSIYASLGHDKQACFWDIGSWSEAKPEPEATSPGQHDVAREYALSHARPEAEHRLASCCARGRESETVCPRSRARGRVPEAVCESVAACRTRP